MYTQQRCLKSLCGISVVLCWQFVGAHPAAAPLSLNTTPWEMFVPCQVSIKRICSHVEVLESEQLSLSEPGCDVILLPHLGKGHCADFHCSVLLNIMELWNSLSWKGPTRIIEVQFLDYVPMGEFPIVAWLLSPLKPFFKISDNIKIDTKLDVSCFSSCRRLKK